MNGFFSMDGAFAKAGTIIADIIIMSLLWLLFSLPLVTVGASTTAMYYVFTRRVSNREGYLIQDFWRSFKSNFKMSTAVWLITAAIAAVLATNIMNMGLMGDLGSWFLPFQIAFAVEAALMSFYVYGIIARFDMTFKDTLKTAFAMANKHLPTSILSLIMAAALVYGLFVQPLFALFAMGIFVFAHSYLLMRVFRKHRPEIDRDPSEIPPEGVQKGLYGIFGKRPPKKN